MSRDDNQFEAMPHLPAETWFRWRDALLISAYLRAKQLVSQRILELSNLETAADGSIVAFQLVMRLDPAIPACREILATAVQAGWREG